MMFGDFAQNFGLSFPMQGADIQGGLFGQNSPVGPPETGAGSLAATGAPQGGLPAPPPAGVNPAAGVGAAPAGASPLASPLGLPGQSVPQTPPPQAPQPELPAPAAGVGSPFGKAGV